MTQAKGRMCIVVLCGALFDAMTSRTSGSGSEAEYLSDLQDRLVLVEQSWGVLGVDTAVHAPDQTPKRLRIRDEVFAKGLGTHANSRLLVLLDGEFREFEAKVGLLWHEGAGGSVVFRVIVDDVLKFDSGVMRRDDTAQKVSVDVRGASVIQLVVADAGDGIINDAGIWAEARLLRDYAAKSRPVRNMDIGAFARVVGSGPARVEGTRAGRLEEFPAEDVFLEGEISPRRDGTYVVPTYEGSLACIGLQWAERRVLKELSLPFAAPSVPPSPEQVRVEYWSSEGRTDDWSSIGQTLWQGRWAPLDGKLSAKGDTLTFLVGSKVPEFTTWSGTHKVRWVLPAAPESYVVRHPLALTKSRFAIARFQVALEKPLKVKRRVELYNGFIVTGSTYSRSQVWDLSSPLTVTLKYTTAPRLPDRTMIRFQLPAGAFSVAVDDIAEHGCVYVRDFGLFVTTDPPKTTLMGYKKRIAGKRTVLARVREMPDQTLERARSVLLNPNSNNDPMMLSLACDNNKTILHRNGQINFGIVPEARADVMSDLHCQVTPLFGSGRNERLTRRLVGGWLPAPLIQVEEGEVVYSELNYVVPVDGRFHHDATEWLSDRPLGVAEFKIENRSDRPADASLRLTILADSKANRPPSEMKQVPNGVVAAESGRLLLWLNTAQCGGLGVRVEGANVMLMGSVPAKGELRCILYTPRWEMKPDEHHELDSAPHLFSRMKAYWERLLSRTMQVEIPDLMLQTLLLASQVHTLIAARNADGGRLIAPWIAAATYGPLDTEAQPVISATGYFGHTEFARRSLDYFLKQYTPSGYLAHGYTLMGTGQNLWTIGQHFRLTRDERWLREVAPRLVTACMWIEKQREKTKKLDSRGDKVPEYGLVPPGVIADWNRYAYYFYVNGYFQSGMQQVAESLTAISYPSAGSIARNAADYRADLMRAYKWNQARMPVVPLRDGTWVPACPSSLYCFGLTNNYYKGVSSFGHDVEVGGNHLINLGLIDPKTTEADWIVNYLEDAWFLRRLDISQYPEDKLEKDWFTYGGFAKLQPYYVHHGETLALRDDVKPFIRTYFNSPIPMLSEETLALWEHFNQMGAWNKTHETAGFLIQTRMALVMERGDELWLAPFVADNWMKDGMVVAVKNAPTHFGAVSYRIASHVEEGHIEALVEPPTRNLPKALVLRLRHPDGKRMRRVTVNGVRHSRFDAQRECVFVKPANKTISVRADY